MAVEYHGDINQPANAKGQRVDVQFHWRNNVAETNQEEI